MQIAGNKTEADWFAIRDRVQSASSTQLWQEIARDYFRGRLSPRYLDPIELLRTELKSKGEGFSIVVIQCSLLEFLETTVRGFTYRYRLKDTKRRPYEYSKSKKMFMRFLTTREPFKKSFSAKLAKTFYESIRCGVLHEAQTKNGWRIWDKSALNQIIDEPNRIVYRDDFQEALLAFIVWYENQLPHDTVLQKAFIRKYNNLAKA